MDFCFAYWIISFWLLSLFTLLPTYPDSVSGNTGFWVINLLCFVSIFVLICPIIKHFLAFWHQMFQDNLVLSQPKAQTQPFLQGVLLPFSREYCLKTRICDLAVVITIEMFFSGHAALQSYHTYIHTHTPCLLQILNSISL